MKRLEKEKRVEIVKELYKRKAVIFCWVSPKEKQDIIQLVKEAVPNVNGLAIGDGANDVNMILEAHVGIGVQGREGSQATWVADISIPKFYHL